MCENWFHVAKLYKKYQTGYYDAMKFAFAHITTPQKQEQSDNTLSVTTQKNGRKRHYDYLRPLLL